MELNAHYSHLLGIGEEWKITDVRIDLEKMRVDIFIEYAEKSAPCPICDALSPMSDKRDERIWRHLETMQLATYLHVMPSRCRCHEHGVKVIDIPWAEKSSGTAAMQISRAVFLSAGMTK